MKIYLLFLALVISGSSYAQANYKDSMLAYQRKYVKEHAVVAETEKERMNFYDVNAAFRVVAEFTPSSTANWIQFKTSGKQDQTFRVYGTASFAVNGKTYQLNIYQSQDLMTNPQLRNYLFLPFTDLTTSHETYSGGHYIDLTTEDIADKKIVIDFNKAYNPYFAYVTGVYNCPLPPKENALALPVLAGEKSFKAVH